MFLRVSLLISLLVSFIWGSAQQAVVKKSKSDVIMKEKAIADLKSLLYSEERWIKVHVAEFLIWENQLIDEVRDEFLKENELYNEVSQYRIGIWRVLAQASTTKDERRQWEDKIVSAYQDESGLDRLHAIETLAKLRHAVMEVSFLEEFGQVSVTPYSLYQLWNLSCHSGVLPDAIMERLLDHMEQNIENEQSHVNMLVSSYILRSFPKMPEKYWERLNTVFMQARDHTGLQASILATLWMTQPRSIETVIVDGMRQKLNLFAKEKAGVNHTLMAFARKANNEDLVEIQSIFNRLRDRQAADYDADLHASAAYAMLSYVNAKIEKADVK